MNKEEFNKLYETLKKSKFKQQKFPAWRPLPTISCITIIFISTGIVFIIIGILILVFTGQIKEFKFRYDIQCFPTSNNKICTIPLTIPEKMKKPIMIYYQLNDFSQNHRYYMDAKSDKQFKGEEVSKEDLEKSGQCENALYNEEIGNYAQYNSDLNGKGKDIAFPCGEMAKSFFRDRIISCKLSGTGKEINITTEEIAYKSDRDSFSKVEMKNNHWIDINDEQFMIWMRVSPFKDPRKLWGKIENDDISADSKLMVTIENNKYQNFEKYIILSTRNVFGGKNSFLGICYVVFGGICLLSAIIFINVYNYVHKKK